jgi:hypothetical protein
MLLGALMTLSAILAYQLDAEAQQVHVNYTNITGQATATLKPGPGFLQSVCFNKPVATEVITIFDSLAGSGTTIATITIPSSPMPVCLPYNVSFNVGLTVVTATASSDITVSWQ